MDKHRHYPQAAQVMAGLWGISLIITVPLSLIGLVAQSQILFEIAIVAFAVFIPVGLFGGLLLGSLGYESPPIKWLRSNEAD